MNKHRMQRNSSSSLPPTPLNLDGVKMHRSHSTMSSYGASPTAKSIKELEGLRSANLKELNTRLVNYVEKVRLMNQAADVLDSAITKNQQGKENLQELKSHYEVEISDWREKYDEMASLYNKAKHEATSLKKDNKNLTDRLSDGDKELKEKDGNLATMEAEINELLSKLNMLQTDKTKLASQNHLLGKDLEKQRMELDSTRKALDREQLNNAQMTDKFRGAEQDYGFKLQVIKKELDVEKKKNTLDLSAMNKKLKDEYESRLEGELKSLRKMYDTQVEKARRDYATLHSRKLAEAQEQLNRERSGNNSAAMELEGALSRIEEYKKITASLEKEKLELEQKLRELEQNLREQGATFRAQMTAKNREISSLQDQLVEERAEYETLVKLNHELDLEIETYRHIIDGELDRLQNKKESTSVEIKSSSSSSSHSESDEGSTSFSRSQTQQMQDTTDGRTNNGRRRTVYTTHIKKTSTSRM